MDQLKIGVSGINAIDNPGPGIGVARSVKEDKDLDTEIVGLAYDAMEPGVYMDWVVDKSFLIPYPSGEGDAYFDRLAYIKESHGLDVLIPNLDAELPIYIKHAKKIEEMGIKTFLPTMEQFKLRGKDKLADIAKSTGIELPETHVVTSMDKFLEALDETGLPVMIKGAFYKAYRAFTTNEAIGYYHSLVAEWGYPVIVQKVVTGDELNVVGVGDGEGGSLGLFALKKMSVTSLGKIWTGVSIKHEAMLETASKFLETSKWRGPFELECIVDGNDVYLVEVNPRFPAWVYFATGVGINLPSRMIRLCCGMEFSRETEYEAGKLFVRYSYELVTDMSRFQKAITRGETP